MPSLTIDELASMLWDIIRYENFDTESPYNRDAALWAKMQTDYRFPINVRSIRDKVAKPNFAVPVVFNSPKPEIIETGIEIIEQRHRPASPPNDGIIFLD